MKLNLFEPTAKDFKLFSPQNLSAADEKIVAEINRIESDIEKILEYENLLAKQKNFMIIDKAKSKADIYKGRDIIADFEVGIGETKGDELNSATYHDGFFSKEGRTTPSGQFTTTVAYEEDIFNREDYKNGKCINLLLLKGVQHPADFRCNTTIGLHQIPQTHPERIEMFAQKGSRRGMSTGCVNFMPEDFYRMAENITPTGTHVYILPEDEGNKLELVRLPKKFWFKTKYADSEKENDVILAMKKFFKLT